MKREMAQISFSIFLLAISFAHASPATKIIPIESPTCEHENDSESGRLAEIRANKSPVIGILAQEYFSNVGPRPAPPTHSYIAASYVKWVESAGGRVVPIWINKQKDYYTKLLASLNGVLLPGGGNFLDSRSGYGRAASIIWQHVLAANEQARFYPLWGTCLGMEEIVFQAVGQHLHWFSHCDAEDLPLPLSLHSNSRLLHDMPDGLVNILANENVTAHYHSKCLSMENFYASRLNESFRLIGSNTIAQRATTLTFVSALEHIDWPIYAVQFHPEKPAFEHLQRKKLLHTPHSAEAVEIGQYFANFFVREARQNSNHFANETEEYESLIYAYSPVRQTSLWPEKAHFEQVYIFPL